jgi:hypothetical protein
VHALPVEPGRADGISNRESEIIMKVIYYSGLCRSSPRFKFNARGAGFIFSFFLYFFLEDGFTIIDSHSGHFNFVRGSNQKISRGGGHRHHNAGAAHASAGLVPFPPR